MKKASEVPAGLGTDTGDGRGGTVEAKTLPLPILVLGWMRENYIVKRYKIY